MPHDFLEFGDMECVKRYADYTTVTLSPEGYLYCSALNYAGRPEILLDVLLM